MYSKPYVSYKFAKIIFLINSWIRFHCFFLDIKDKRTCNEQKSVKHDDDGDDYDDYDDDDTDDLYQLNNSLIFFKTK